ncbi:MAG TPA: glycosyl hydrolase family 8 [Bacteroidales bacterium]|jgi:oligosaccharide reducing-end xylanase|nr:glycosyl hydrolase family 8 [Bacteroidales bacterium]
MTFSIKKLVPCLIALFTGGFMISGCATNTAGRINDDGSGAYVTGTYRNLFLENGHSREEITNKLNAAFHQLFHGDSSQRIYFESGNNRNGALAYLCDVLHNDVRSEGMSYGMMICVQMDKKAEFDALWNWALTYMYNHSENHPASGYFKWSVGRDGIAFSETPAPDGEEYFVTALYFAAHRWGNGEGIYDYKAYADTILSDMRHHQIKTGKAGRDNVTIGPMVNEEHKMILFVPNAGQNNFTDPSYHLPAFYELWSRWGPEADREFWADAADSSRTFFMHASHKTTGLSTDYANFDGTPHFVPWNPNSVNFAYDSWRTAGNWAVDWSWWQKDKNEQELSNRIQSFFAGMGVTTYGHVFKPSGEVLNPAHRTGLAAVNATVSLATTHDKAKEFVEDFWNASVPQIFGDRYYDGTLYLMNLLHCSGEFKIWKP